MGDGIWAATSGAVAQERTLSVIANNVANANTTGYRADRVAFRESLRRAAPDGPAPEDIRMVSVSRVDFTTSSGVLHDTGNPLDVALEGDGYFAVRDAQGNERYQRAGHFVTDAQGTLRTPDGLAVLARPDNPGQPPREITLPMEQGADIVIGTDGSIQSGGTSVGQLRVVRFDAGQLTKEGLTRFVANGAPQDAYDTANVRQGMLEGSNLNAVQGMTQLINVSRSFDAFQKVIDTYAEMNQRTARDITRSGG